ncbi:MAG: 3-oxoacyl-[acyl-carrier-protein] reductase [Gemella sp.]|nr:3-oxoacyl-[acyl-carrier-protein] reductase [Gemella sp.]
MSKVAVVTGASGGIGRAVAIKLAKDGFDLVLNYNGSYERALATKEECEEFGVKADVYKFNVADYKETEEAFNKIVEDFGRIDVLVNNSGITRDGLLLRMKEEDFDDVIDINLKGAFNCVKHVSKIMLKQKSGNIINMTSVVGVSGNAGQVNYSASKAGMIGMTKSVAKELVTRNIRCNAVAPGFIETEMTEQMTDKAKEAVYSQIPMRKLGSVEDVANLVSFLASDASSYITGQVINVDGGMLI